MIFHLTRYALPVVVGLLVTRTTGGFIAVTLFAVAVLALRLTANIPHVRQGLLASAPFALCVGAASIGVALYGGSLTDSYAYLPLPFAVIAFSLYSGPPELRKLSVQAIERGLFWGFAIVFAIATAEIVFGFSLALARYPDALGNDVLASNRLLAASVYPSYNGIAMAGVLALALTFGRLGAPSSLPRKISLLSYAVLVLTISGFTASRTFLLGAALLLAFIIIGGWKTGARSFGKALSVDCH